MKDIKPGWYWHRHSYQTPSERTVAKVMRSEFCMMVETFKGSYPIRIATDDDIFEPICSPEEVFELYTLLDQARTLVALSCSDCEITKRIDEKLKEWNK